MGLNLLIEQIEAKLDDCTGRDYFCGYKQLRPLFDLYIPDASPEDVEEVLSQTTLESGSVCNLVSVHKGTKVLEGLDREYLKELAREVRDLQYIDGLDFEEQGISLDYLNLVDGLAYLGYIDRSKVPDLTVRYSGRQFRESLRTCFSRSSQSPSS